MRRRSLKSIATIHCVTLCVPGGQGSPQGPGPCGPAKTPGSPMNPVYRPAAVCSHLSRAAFRIALFAVLAILSLSAVQIHAQSAKTFFKRGQDAEARENYDTAFDNYQKALAKSPTDIAYRAAVYRVRLSASSTHIARGRKLMQAGDAQAALAEFLHAAEIDPGNEAAQQEIARVRQAQNGQGLPPESAVPEPAGEQQQINSMAAPAVLKPLSNEPLTLHMTEDAKVVYQAIGRAAGVNVLFDPDYTSKRIQVDLTNVSLLDALRIVGTISNTFWRPVTSNTIFVAQDTRIKRTELDEQAVQTFYLTNASQQNDLNDVQTALRNVLPNAKVYGVASQSAIVMRATPDELLLAQKLIDDLDKARPEVVVDIGVLEVSKNWERTLGISWPSSVGVSLQPTTASSTSSTSSSTTATGTTTSTSTTPTLYDLANLKASNFAVSVGSATLNLLLNDASTRILQSPRIRATDDQKATMKIGSRIPIATGSYSAPGLAATAAIGYAQTQFQYQDVGVNIEMTPTVHYDRDVTLKIKIEVTAQSGQVTISGVTEPILSQRVIDQVIRLRSGEVSILGGIQNNQEQNNWTGIPGLSAIPILKYVFGSKDRIIQNDDIVFVVVPHIVRSQELDQANLRAIDTGAGQAIDLRHVSNAATPAAQPTMRPTAYEQPATGTAAGTVPGQTAQAGAPLALAQPTLNAPPAAPPTVAARPPGPLGAAPPGPKTAPPAALPAQGAAPPAGASATQASATQASLSLNAPTGPVPVGTAFQVPIAVAGATNLTSLPLQMHYDATKLTLVNVLAGNLLNRDGQAAAVVHRDDGPGNLTIVASRPPGAAGVSGAGVMCVLTFQAKAAGASELTITRASEVNSAQQQTAITGKPVNILVR